MKPDYQIKNVKLYCCDNMEFMKQIPDNYYNLAVVDPPYGIENKISIGGGSHTKNKTKFHQRYIENNKMWDIRPLCKYWEELFRISKNQIVFGANYFSNNLPISRGWIFWDKQGEKMSSVNNELIWTSFDISIKTFSRCHGKDKGFMADHKVFHPTTKPKAIYKWILTNYAKENDKIFDSHGGSFSSACACLDMGFDFDGCEIDQEYFDNAVNRLKNNVQEYLDFT